MQDDPGLPGILASIVATKREELAALGPRAAEIERAAAAAPPARSLEEALRKPESVALIAECKRRSPGAGPIRPDLDPLELTRSYEDAGASALSVLTDRSYFGGSDEDLSAVRAARSIPVLRKDFTLDPLHVVEARAAGADAVLLIVRLLDDARLRALHAEATALGMSVLVETHDDGELERALGLGATIVGINNRDLATFTTDLETTLHRMQGIPDEVIVVSESGIRGPDDVARLGAAGVDAVLVGETLLRGEDPGAVAASLSGIPKSPRAG